MNPITIIAFHPTGYELHIPVTFEELPTTMRRLAARGYTPSREPVLTAEGLPVCPRHGVPMQQRNRNGDLWFSHKMVHPETGETVYCRGYAGASSPGYDILQPTAVSPHTAVRQAQASHEAIPEPPTGADSSQKDNPINGRLVNQPPQQEMALHTALFGQRS